MLDSLYYNYFYSITIFYLCKLIVCGFNIYYRKVWCAFRLQNAMTFFSFCQQIKNTNSNRWLKMAMSHGEIIKNWVVKYLLKYWRNIHSFSRLWFLIYTCGLISFFCLWKFSFCGIMSILCGIMSRLWRSNLTRFHITTTFTQNVSSTLIQHCRIKLH